MNEVFGQLFPIAAGIAISPIPISAVILLLLTPRAAADGIAFLIGWIVGVFVPTAFVVLGLTALREAGVPTMDTVVEAWILLVLGLACLYFGYRQWRRRPRHGEKATPPAWMERVEHTKPPVALVLGFALSAFNPEDLLLSISGGVVIATATILPSDQVTATLVFTALGSLTVAIPVIVYLVARKRVAGYLSELRVWLQQNNAVVMACLLFVIGVVLLGKAIGDF